ncbi:MAG: DciA family protein [Dethiobacter sp.]
MISIEQLLIKTLKNLPNPKQIKGQMLIDTWPDVVGLQIAAKAKATMFQNGILFVWVRDSVWAQHLSLQKKQIVGSLNKAVRTDILTNIHYQVGGKEPVFIQINQPQKKENWREEMLKEQILTRIEKAFENVPLTQELEEIIKGFFISQQKRIQWYRQRGYPSCSICGMPIVTAQREEICLCCKTENTGQTKSS